MDKEEHFVDIIPPDAWDQPYTVRCSFKDLFRKTMIHAEAKEIDWGHASNIMLRKRESEAWELTPSIELP
jgi:hypothetical protein